MIEQAICRCFPRSSPTKWRRSFGVAERRARACHGALGNARAVAVRRGADHEHSERGKPALATMARAGEPVRRSATSFCEYADTKPRKTPKWFALSENRPLFAFAGLWTPWRGLRGPKSAPIEGEHELNRRVGHPVKRDVVEHVVAGEAIRRAPIDRAPTTADMIAAAGWP